MRSRAVAVVVRDGHVLVIRRRKGGREYTVLPGGGIEAGESPRAACLRELREETGLQGDDVTPLPIPTSPESRAHYFEVAVAVTRTALRLGGPELERASADNLYEPQWVPLESVDDIGLVPAEAVRAVAAAGLLARG